MNQKQPMTVEFNHKDFCVELCGDNAKVWKGYGLPSYEGPIDGIQSLYPDLFAALIKAGYIRATV